MKRFIKPWDVSAAEISLWGAVLVVVGVATGVLMIVSGAGLLKRRGEIMF